MNVFSKIFLLFSSIFLAPQVFGVSFDNCKNEDWLEKRLDKILDVSRERDASTLIKNFVLVAKRGCSNAKARAIKNYGETLRIHGLRNHVEFMRREAIRVAQYRKPEEELREITRAQRALRDAGEPVPRGLSTTAQNEILRRGQRNSLTRKRACRNVDNRKPPLVTLNSSGKVIRNNMRNQDSIGWCYAFTAADLISHKTGKNISAVDIANAYNEGSWSDFFNSNESDMEGALRRVLLIQP